MKDLLGYPQCGMIWEGFVMEQFIGHFGKKYDYYFYRTQDGTEADLALVKGGKSFAIVEAKFNNAPVLTKDTYNAIVDLKTKHNYVVTPRQEKYITDIGKELKLSGIETLIKVKVL